MERYRVAAVTLVAAVAAEVDDFAMRLVVVQEFELYSHAAVEAAELDAVIEP